VPLVTLARPAADWAPLAYTSFVPVGYLAEMSGLLKQGQGPSLRVLGHMSFKGTHTGPFTGKVYWEGVSYSLAGTFAGGTYTGSVTRTGKPPLSVSLGFFYNGATPDTGEWRVHGQVSDGVNTADAVILENFDWNATNHMGTYTIAIPGEDNGSPTEPQGSAYGSLVINNKGDGTLKLTLPDGTPTVSLPVYLSNQPTGGPECAFYIPVGTGFIAGEFRLRDEAGVSDLDGYVNWRKAPATTGSYYLGGFNLNRSILGCRFATLANLPDLPGVLTTAQAQFFGGNLSYVPGVRLFSWSALDKLAGLNPGETWTFSVSAATTAITGTYKHTATGSTFKFGGSIFQKQSKVAGHLLGVQQSGSMSMTP
jgi:hypothetical protein